MNFYSSIEPIYYLLPFIGFVVGLLGTMLGGGGGFFFMPVLILLINVTPQTAVITSLVASLPICIVGSLGHYHRKNIDFKLALMFGSAGILGAFFGTAISNRISPEQLKTSFGIYSVLIAINIVFGTWRKQRAFSKGAEQTNNSKIIRVSKGSFFGFFAGLITGTFGTSGTAPVLAGLFSMRIPLKMVIGTSLLIVLVNTLFAIGSHFFMGKIDLTLVWFLTAGSALGALAGPKLLTKVKTDHAENKIRYLYASVIAVMGILMIIGK